MKIPHLHIHNPKISEVGSALVEIALCGDYKTRQMLRKCHACGVSEGILYVIGGTDEQQPVMQSECLDLRQKTAMDDVTNL